MFALAILASAIALGRAIQISNGAFSPEAFTWATRALVFALIPIFLPAWPAVDRGARRLLVPALAVGLAYQFSVLVSTSPGIYLQLGEKHSLADFQSMVIASALTCGLILGARGHRRLAPLLLLIYTAMGIWTLRTSPNPHIDVFSIHQQSLAALLRGIDPYTITFPNPYHSTVWFAPGTATNERLLFGYVYPAWTLLVALPGYVLAHDFRYGFLVVVVASAALGIYARPQTATVGAMAIFLFTPRNIFVLEQGWTEPTLLIGVAISVYAACRGHLRWLLPIGLGIVACAKQYSVLAAPAALLLIPLFPNTRAFGVMLLKALGVAAIVTLPFALWHPAAYWHDVFGIQFTAPIRTDALSIPAFWFHEFGKEMPKSLHIGAPVLLVILALIRAPRTVSGFAWAGGTIYFVFFMFRQGFGNYYYLVIAIYALAIAAGATRAREYA